MKIALDIDDTIAATNLHWAKLCYDKFGYSDDTSLENILRKYEYVRHVPAWTENNIVSEFFVSLDKWLEIPPIDQSFKVIKEYKNLFSCYLTTRPFYLRSVTLEWLSLHDFPKLPLYMPDDDINNLQWKANILINSLPNTSGIIDDNLEFLDILRKLNYKGYMFYIGNHCNKNANKDILSFISWADVRSYLNKEFGLLK